MDRDLVVGVLCRCAQPDVDGGHLVAEEVGHEALAFGPEEGETFGGRGSVLLVADVLGRRPDEHVAEHGRREQDALGPPRGHGQDDVVEKRARELVKDDQLASTRSDRESPVTEHAVDLVAAEPRGVDEESGCQGATGSGDAEAALVEGLDPGHRRVKQQLAAGENRFGGERQRRRERADDALVRNLERASRSRPEVRLAPIELLDADLADRFVAVRPRALDDRGESISFVRAPGDEQRADRLHGDADLRRIGAEQLVASAVESGLERARRHVEPGVEERRVRLAGAGTDIGARLEQRAPELEAAELSRNGRADHTAADDNDVAVEHYASWARASADACQRARRPAASSADIFGSKTADGDQFPTASAGVAAPRAPSRANAPTPSAVASADG